MNNKNTLLKTMDILIITVIVIQFIIFLLNYETEFLITIISILQFVFLVLYLVFSIRLRAYFETIVNQENVFFNKQFAEIKDDLDEVNYQISEYFDRQRDIENIRHQFHYVRLFYQEDMALSDDERVSIDLLLITEKGIFIVDFFEARFILRGDYQKDIINLQYARNHMIQILNPLSNVHPLVKGIKDLFGVEYEAIKRLMIIEDESNVAGMHTLAPYQEIAKEQDIKSKIQTLIDQSETQYTLEEIEAFEKKLDQKIIG